MAGNTAQFFDQTDDSVRDTLGVENYVASLRPILHSPHSAGQEVFSAMSELQGYMHEQGYDLESDETYIIAGYKNRAAFTAAAKRAAYRAAEDSFYAAQDKIGFIAARDDIQEHPVSDLSEAYEWLKYSGKPLFSNQTYKIFSEKREGVIHYYTRETFLKKIREAHMDCAAQKIRLCAEELATTGPTQGGYDVFRSIYADHFKVLGVGEDVDDGLGMHLGYTPAKIDEVAAAYDRWYTQQAIISVIEDKKNSKRSPNDIEYAWGILSIWDDLQEDDALREDPDTYAGTKIDKKMMESEFDRCTKVILKHHLNAIRNADEDFKFYGDAIDDIEKLRDIVGNYDGDPVPEVVQPDYWHLEIFKDYGWKSYRHFMETMNIKQGLQIIKSVAHLDPENADTQVELHIALQNAWNHFQAAHVTLKEDGVLKHQYNLDINDFLKRLGDSAAVIANTNWKNLTFINISTEEKIKAAEEMFTADSHIGHDQKEILAYDIDDADKAENRLLLRRAEELLADSLICLPGRLGALETFKEAFLILQDMDMTVLSGRFIRAAHLSKPMAQHLKEYKELLSVVADWQDALDEDMASVMRLDCIEDVRKALEKMSEREKKIFLVYAGLQDLKQYETMRSDLALAALKEYGEIPIMKDPDQVRKLDIMETIVTCVRIIAPTITADASPLYAAYFRKITGLDYAIFNPEYERLKRLSEKAKLSRHRVYDLDDKTITDSLRMAQNPDLPQAKAFHMIEDLARRLRHDGKSILFPHLLATVDWKIADLQSFVREKALGAAAACVFDAVAKGHIKISAHSWAAHSYGKYLEAFQWILKANYPATADEPYQAIGFKDRRAFMDVMTDALMDITAQMEKLASNNGKNNIGARQFFKLLKELRENHQFLGMEDVPMIRRLAADKTPVFSHLYGVEKTQRALRSMGMEAFKDITKNAARMDRRAARDKKYRRNTDAYRYKEMRSLYRFADNMYAKEWAISDAPDGGPFATTIAQVVKNRIEGLLEQYKAHPGEPSRGVRVVQAIKFLADQHNLYPFEWFQDIFPNYNAVNFASYSEQKCEAHIVQIIKRTVNTLSILEKEEGPRDPGMLLSMMRDLKQLDSVVEKGLIKQAVVNDILDHHSFGPELIKMAMEKAAYHGLPLMLMQVQDPLLSNRERLNMVSELRALMAASGPEAVAEAVDEAQLQKLETKTRAHLVAGYLATDLLRGIPEMVSDITVLAQAALLDIKTTLQDTELLRGLGLKDDEIKAYGELSNYVPIYETLERLTNTISMEDIQNQHVFLEDIFEYAETKGIQLWSDDTFKKIGMEGFQEFMERVDQRVFYVLSSYSNPIEDLSDNPEQILNQRDIICDFLERTKIKERYTGEFVMRAGVMTEQGLNVAFMTAQMRGEGWDARYVLPRHIPTPVNSNDPKPRV